VSPSPPPPPPPAPPPPAASAQTGADTRGSPAPSEPETGGRKLPSWTIIAAAGGGVALIIIGVLVAINWAPEERFGSISAPNLDRSLAGGGLSSSVLGIDASVSSLEERKPDGFRLVADAVGEDVVDEFQQAEPGPKWTSEFSLNDGDLTMYFAGGGKEDSEFFLDYPGQQNKTADEIFAIARAYGFYSDDTRSQLTEIEDEVDSIIDDFNARELTEDVPESDLVSRANAAADDLDQWLDDFGDYEIEVRAVEAERAVMLQVAAVAQNPTNAGLDEYNRLIDEMNDAIDEYNEET
jgi:hypothetical protein